MADSHRPGFSTGRTVKARELQYIPRQADADLLDHCRNGRPAYLLHAPQMGKSSLLAHTAEQLNNETHHAIILDLSQFPLPPREEEWFTTILNILDDHLDLTTDAFDWWDAHQSLPPSARLTQFLTEIALTETTKPLVFFLDEIERTLTLPFRLPFFSWLGTLYESRATNSDLYRLSFVISGVATPAQLIPESKPSVFEWSHRVILSDFTLQQALPLAEGLSLPTESAINALKRVYEWTAGHPYLTQLLCQVLEEQHRSTWSDTEIDECIQHFLSSPQGQQDRNLQLVRTALTEPNSEGISLIGPYRDFLEGHDQLLKDHPLLRDELRLTGILKDSEEEVALRNNVYQEVFSLTWAKRYVPTAQPVLSPKPTSYGRYFLVASFLLIGLGFLFWFFRAPNFQPPPVTLTNEAPLPSMALKEPSDKPTDSANLIAAQETIQELENTIAEYQRLSKQELNSVQDQRTHLEDKLLSQDTILSELRAEVETLESALLEQQNAHQQAILDLSTEREKLSSALTSTTNERDTAKKEIKVLQTALLKQSSLSPLEIKQLIADRNQLEAKLTAVGQKLTGVQQQTQELTASLAQQELNANLEGKRFDSTKAKLQTQLNTLQAELRQTKEALKRTEQHSHSQQALAQEELARLQQARAEAQQQFTANQRALNEYHDRVATLKTQNAKYRQDLKESLETNTTLSAQLQDLQNTEAQIQNRVAQLESNLIQQKNTADSQRHSLQQERDEFSDSLTKALADLQTTNNRMATLTAELRSTKQELASRQLAQQDIHAASSEKNRRAEEQVAALTQTNTELESRVRQSKEILQQAQQRITDLEDHSEKTTNLTEALEAKTEEREKLNATLAATQQKLDNAQQQILSLEATLEKKSPTFDFSLSAQTSYSPKTKKSQTEDSPIRKEDFLSSHIIKFLSQSSNSHIPHQTRLLLARQAFLFTLQSEGQNWSSIDQILRELSPASAINLRNIDEDLGVLTFDPGGNRLIGSTKTGSIWIWSLKYPANSPKKFQSIPTTILSLAISPNGKWLASGGEDQIIRVWDTFSPNRPPQMLRGHKKAITALAFNPENDRLVSGSKDRIIRFWDFSTSPPESLILGRHSDWVNSLFFSADKKRVISLGEDRNILEWDPSNMGSPIRIFRFQKHGLSPFALHPSGWIIAKELQNNQIGIWNLQHPSHPPNNLRGNIGHVSSLQFSPKGRYLVSISSGNSVRLWNWESFNEPSILLSEGKNMVSAMAISSDSHKIAIAREGKSVILWPSTENLAESICKKIQRNLTLNEWKKFIGDAMSYERTCWSSPLHASFLEEGRKLARKGSREEALTIFKRAKELDPYLEFDPKKEVEKLSPKSS